MLFSSFFMTMKKRNINPIGPLVIDFIKEHASSLNNYLLKRNRIRSSLPRISQMILTSISALDLFFIEMIVSITGWWIMTLFAYWKRMLVIHHGLMFQLSKGNCATRTTTKNMTLPEWDIEQERYWQDSTVNSVLEYTVSFYAFVKERTLLQEVRVSVLLNGTLNKKKISTSLNSKFRFGIYHLLKKNFKITQLFKSYWTRCLKKIFKMFPLSTMLSCFFARRIVTQLFDEIF